MSVLPNTNPSIIKKPPVSQLGRPQPLPDNADEEPRPEWRRFEDVAKTRQFVYDNVLKAAQKNSTISNARHTLRLSNLKYANEGVYDLAQQKAAILAGKSLHRRLVGDWELIDNATNKVIDSKPNITIAQVPFFTDRGTFVLRGTEYSLANQLRLRPGIYTRIKDNGEIEAHANLIPGKGLSHRYFLDPAKGIYYINIGQAKIPLMPLLKAMGAKDKELQEAWGNELWQANAAQNNPALLNKLIRKIVRDKNAPDKTKALLDAFANMEVDPSVTQRTLGKPYANIDLGSILATTKKLLAISRGEMEVDDRDHMAYQNVYGPEDLIAERFEKDWAGIRRSLLFKSSFKGDLSPIRPGALTKQLQAAILFSGLGSCFDKKTLVLTRRGWVPWPEIEDDDEFACRIDGKIEYHRAKRITREFYTGEMIGCANKYVNYLVTPKHRMWCRSRKKKSKYRFVTAEKLFGKSCYFETSLGPLRNPKRIHHITLDWIENRHGDKKSIKIDIDTWLQFLGWWLAEGSACKTGPNSYVVTIAQKNEKYRPEIEAILDKMPFHWLIGSRDNDYIISSKGLYEHLVLNCGTKTDKRIPRYVFELHEDKLRLLFECLIRGVGSDDHGDSKTQLPAIGLVYDLAELWSRFDKTAQISWQDRTAEGWKIYATASFSDVAKRGVVSQSRLADEGISNYYYEDYDDLVYCAEVPGNMLFVMRNGRPMWASNSIEEINNSELLDKQSRFTRLGEGGIGSSSAVPKECYDDKTEVFTSAGWLSWSEVNENTLLACKINGRTEFHNPIKLIAQHYKGRMYGCKTRVFNYLVTPNHRMWVKSADEDYHFETAEECFGKPRIFDGSLDGSEHYSADEDHYYYEDYDGVVYCAEVPGGLLYVRRDNSTGIWSGNSRSVQPSHAGFVDPARTPECGDPSTEVYTQAGWKFWPDVTENDKLACLVDGEMKFLPPIRLIKAPYDGEMIGVKTSMIDSLVTPSHRMWVKPYEYRGNLGYRFELAEDGFGKGRIFDCGPKGYSGDPSITHFKLPEVDEVPHTQELLAEPIDIKLWAALLGWYISEGCLAYNKATDKAYAVYISQSKAANPETYSEIKDLLDSLPFNYKAYIRNFRISNLQLATYFRQFGYCNDKYLPEEVFSWPKEAREVLLNCLLKGDGRKSKKRKHLYQYTTTSKQLADDVAKLAYSLGKSCRVTVEKDDREERYLNVYVINLHDRTERVAIKRHYYKTHYKGFVYCAEVPGGLLYTRRNNSTGMWSGNSLRAGVDANFASPVYKAPDGKIYAPFINVKTGKKVYRSPQDLADATVAFPGELERNPKSKRIGAMRNGKLGYYPRDEIDYVIPHFENAFSSLANAVPAKSASKAQRLAMASRMLTQAVSLVNREAPLVQTALPDDPTKSYQEQLSKHMGIVTADKPGRVVSITPDEMKLKYDDGTVVTKSLYNNFPYARKTHIHNTPKVAPGDRFDAGAVLATSNYTDNNGNMALGLNAKIAYLPYKGWPFEDATVISESFARRLASEHMYQEGIEWTPEYKKGKNIFQSIFPGKYKPEQMEKIDKDGFAKPGSVVNHGDPIILAARQRETVKNKLHRKKEAAFVDASVRWEHFTPGVVTDIVQTDGRATALIKTVNEVQVGDKLCYDEETQIRTKQGWKPISEVTCDDYVATLNPETDELEWHKPLNTWHYDHNGLMYYLNTAVVNMLVTIEHNLWVSPSGDKFRPVTAHEFHRLDGTWKFKRDCKWRGVNRAELKIVDRSLNTELWLEFVACYLASGLVKGDTVYLQLLPGEFYKSKVKKILSNLDVAYTHEEGTNRLLIKEDFIVTACRDLGSTSNAKRIPEYVQELCPEQLCILMNTFRSFDPSLTEVNSINSPIRVATADLADDFHLIGMKLGYSVSVFHNKPADKSLDEQWSVTFSKRNRKPKWNRHQYEATKAGEDRLTLYSGKVYCLTVPNHILLVRRNGKHHWSMNSGLYGDKGVVAKIIPDDQMPTDEEGQPFEMLVSPLGVITRTNSSQMIEGALGKIARKTGKPYKLKDFSDIEDLTEFALAELKKHGIPLKETVVDPETGRKIPNIFTGERFIMKLHHLAESKGQGRGIGGYTLTDEPAKGGETGCFIGEQEIITADGPKPISLICENKERALVRTYDEELGRWGYKPITDWFAYQSPVTDVLQIEVAGGHFICATTNHEFYKYDGSAVLAGDLKEGDELVTWAEDLSSKVAMPVVGIRPYKPDKPVDTVMVYDITVDKTHKYCAGPALVSNSKRLSLIDSNALLAAGATQVIRDARVIRGQRNEEFWLPFMQGYTPPPPKIPLIYQKFVSDLKAAGINVVREGRRLNIMAMTNKDIDQLAGDRYISNGETVRFEKGLDPIKGGLFDPSLTGGHGGNRWSAVKLVEPMPNPVMVEPIRRLLGVTEKKFEEVLAGKDDINGFKGPMGIKNLLENINIDKEIEVARQHIKSGRRTYRDAAIRRLKYLKAAKKLNIHPSDWMIDKVPILPPKFRPIAVMSKNKLPLISDINYLYKELIGTNDILKDMKDTVADVSEERMAVYNALKAVTGLGDPVHPKLKEKNVKGILKGIFGTGGPKTGTVQRRLVSSTVDLVGRAVITPDPDLNMDEVALPENRAWNVYRNFVIRRLRRRGMPLIEAAKQVEEKSAVAKEELIKEMQSRPVIVNRAPVLHKFGIMAFWPKLTKDETLKVSPLIVKGFNADFDGDAMQYHVPVDESARQEAIELLLPSKNLLSPADFNRPMHVPSQDYVSGLYAATASRKTNKRAAIFRRLADAVAAYKRGEIEIDDPIEIYE